MENLRSTHSSLEVKRTRVSVGELAREVARADPGPHDQTAARRNVYTTRFPEPGSKWQDSGNGGVYACGANGSRLYYLERRGETPFLMETEFTTEPEVTLGPPRELFTVEGRNFAVAPDGQRFAVEARDDQPDTLSSIVMVQSWFEEFRQRQQRR